MVGSITWRVSAHCTRTFSRIPPLAGRTYSTQHFTTSAFPYNSTHALMSCQCQILNKSVLLACFYYSHPVLMNCQLTFSYSTLLSTCWYWLWMLISSFFLKSILIDCYCILISPGPDTDVFPGNRSQDGGWRHLDAPPPIRRTRQIQVPHWSVLGR